MKAIPMFTYEYVLNRWSVHHHPRLPYDESVILSSFHNYLGYLGVLRLLTDEQEKQYEERFIAGRKQQAR